MVSDAEAENITKRLNRDLKLDEKTQETEIRKALRAQKSKSGKNIIPPKLENKITELLMGKLDTNVKKHGEQLAKEKGIVLGEKDRVIRISRKGKAGVAIVSEGKPGFRAWKLLQPAAVVQRALSEEARLLGIGMAREKNITYTRTMRVIEFTRKGKRAIGIVEKGKRGIRAWKKI